MIETKFGMQTVAFMDSFVPLGRSSGLAIKQFLPPDARISSNLAGTVPYYSGLFSIDEWGLSDINIASQPSVPVGLSRRGHMKRATEQYLLERAIYIQVGHPTVCSCERLCDSVESPQVYFPVGGGNCLRTNYLSRNIAFLRFICASTLPRLYIDCAQEPIPSFEKVPVVSVGTHDGRPTSGVPVTSDTLLRSAHAVAFGNRPSHDVLLGQMPVTGFSQPFLNSFHAGDATTGWIDYSLPVGTRRVHLRTGGGTDCDRVYVGLVSGNKLVARACGLDSEALRPVTLTVRPEVIEPRLVIMDDATGNWGHILASDVIIDSDLDQR